MRGGEQRELDGRAARDESVPEGTTRGAGGSAPVAPGLWRFVARKRAILILACVTLLAVAARVTPFRIKRTIPADTTDFLHVVAMVRGELGDREEEPFRLGNPFYSITILFAGAFTSDWLFAARLVSVIASCLTPAVLCVIAWALDRRLWAGCFAGLLGAASCSLIRLGTTPLAGSLFILLYAVSLLACLMLLRGPTVGRAIFAGVFAGLAWSTWGVGLFCLLAIGIPVGLKTLRSAKQARREDEPRRSRPKALWPLAAFAAVFFLFGRGPAYALRPYAAGMKPSVSYMKVAIVDGGMFAKGAP